MVLVPSTADTARLGRKTVCVCEFMCFFFLLEDTMMKTFLGKHIVN